MVIALCDHCWSFCTKWRLHELFQERMTNRTQDIEDAFEWTESSKSDFHGSCSYYAAISFKRSISSLSPHSPSSLRPWERRCLWSCTERGSVGRAENGTRGERVRGPARSRAFALGTRSQEGKGGAARSLQYIILVVSLGIILKFRRASPATFRGIIVILCSFVFGSV